jgi:hypothetical protein
MTGVAPPRYTPGCLSVTPGYAKTRLLTPPQQRGTMSLKYAVTGGIVAIAFASGIIVGHGTRVEAQARERIFELRTYTAPDGKLEALKSRFRDHTTRLFERHGMKNVGYWVPADEPKSQNTLIYILQHESRAAAEKSWAAFREDAEWKRVAAESQKDGRIVMENGVVSVFMNAIDFSRIK